MILRNCRIITSIHRNINTSSVDQHVSPTSVEQNSHTNVEKVESVIIANTTTTVCSSIQQITSIMLC